MITKTFLGHLRGVAGARLLAVLAVLFGTGCGHIDTTPEGQPDRVLTGAVHFDGTLPTGAEVVVRIIEPPSSEPMRTTASDLPVAGNPTMPRMERVLGEWRQTLASGRTQPVAFEVEYRADDAVLRRGVNVDVRISVGGKVRWRTINAHAVTLRAAPFRQDVSVQQVE